MSAPNVAFCRNLRKGVRGGDVVAHKRALHRAMPDSYTVGTYTNYFGERFENAVRAFQRKHGIQATGKIGGPTHEKLERTHKQGADTWAFDEKAASLAKDFCDDYATTPEERIRDAIVSAGFFWYSHRGTITYCVPTDHRILARDGYRTYDELAIGDQVAVLDPDTHEIRWEPVLAVNVFDYDGDLLALDFQGPKVRCTPEHRWPIERRLEIYQHPSGKAYSHGGQRSMKVAQDMNRRDLIPMTGAYHQATGLLSPRHAALLGWLVTDGSTGWNATRRGVSPWGRIIQSTKKYAEEVAALADRPVTAVREDGCGTITVAREDMEIITSVYNDKGDLPSIVCHLSAGACEAMWQAMMKAEGHIGSDGAPRFSQRPGPVMEAFQILTFLTGRSGVVRAYVGTKDGKRMETLRPKADPRKPWSNVTREHVQTRVWCPTTPSGTWVLEHDGVLLPTGNSQHRPFQIGKPPWYPSRWDCSGFVTACYFAGDALNPNGRPWDGLGYTGTLLTRGRPVAHVTDLEIADLIFYGMTTNASPAFPYGSPTHVALYVGLVNGAHSVLSMGSYPMRLLPYNYRSVNHLRTYEVV